MPRAVNVLLAVIIATTVTLAAYVSAGTAYAVMALVTWCIALVGWLATTARRPDRTPVAFDLYVATLVALMALYASVWRTGAGIGAQSFIATFPLATSAVLTLGALCYWWRLAIGDFAAWTTFAWGVVAAASVFLGGPFGDRTTTHVAAMLAAAVVLVVAIAGMVRLVRGDHYIYRSARPVRTSPDRKTALSVALVALFVPTYATVLYLQAGLLVVAIVCGAMVAGFVVWVRTTLRRPPAPDAILPAYLITLALFLFHVLEEHVSGFAERITAAAHVHWSATQFVEVIVLLGPAIWIAGAIGIHRRHPLGNWIAWFLFVGMMLGEPAHIVVFPFLEGGRYHYFPGMWTSLLPMVPAAYGIWRMLHDDRLARAGGTPATLRHPAT